MTDIVATLGGAPIGLGDSHLFANLSAPRLNLASPSETSGRHSSMSSSKFFTNMMLPLLTIAPGVNSGIPGPFTNTSYISPRLTRAYASIF